MSTVLQNKCTILHYMYVNFEKLDDNRNIYNFTELPVHIYPIYVYISKYIKFEKAWKKASTSPKQLTTDTHPALYFINQSVNQSTKWSLDKRCHVWGEICL